MSRKQRHAPALAPMPLVCTHVSRCHEPTVTGSPYCAAHHAQTLQRSASIRANRAEHPHRERSST